MHKTIEKSLADLLSQERSTAEQVDIVNQLREIIHQYSPFKNEPVDFVKWAPSWKRMARCILRNDYYCKGLGQTQPLSEAYEKFKEIKRLRKQKEEMA